MNLLLQGDTHICLSNCYYHNWVFHVALPLPACDVHPRDYLIMVFLTIFF